MKVLSTKSVTGHLDLLTMEFLSSSSFEDALRQGIADAARVHSDLDFKGYTVVKQEGRIQNNKPTSFAVVVELIAAHKEEED